MPLSANAHSGKTDSSGGHTNHSTGEYHYHHGYSAHDHYDMDGDGDRDCPYDFDDKTDHTNSDNSSYGNDYLSNVQSEKTNWEDILLKAPIILFVLIAVPVVVFFLCAMVSPINFVIVKLSSFATNEEKAYKIIMGIIIVFLQLFFIYKIIILK